LPAFKTRAVTYILTWRMPTHGAPQQRRANAGSATLLAYVAAEHRLVAVWCSHASAAVVSIVRLLSTIVVHGSILRDPIQPNLSADWPNPIQPTTTGKIWTRPDPTRPNTTNNGAYSLTVKYFIHFNTPSDRFLVPVRSAVISNLTASYNQN